jgi:hypothetical protein
MNARIIELVGITVLLAACSVGTKFIKPADDALVLGKTTRSEVLALMGKPSNSGRKVTNGADIDIITYAYASRGQEEPAFEGVIPARGISFHFLGDRLVGKDFSSSFKSDSTWFDPAKARAVVNGMSEADVRALLGRPAGEFLHPIVADRTGRGLLYQFSLTRGFKTRLGALNIELDASRVVTKSEYMQVGD